MKKKFLRGAASFYIVAFSTLILVIIAASFATVVISEVTRTSNDDLSQSAYDSALAGVEDAKLAFSNYRRCLEKGATAVEPNGDNSVTCNEIVWWMEHPNCDMVGHILGRISENGSGEVAVSDTLEATGGGEVTSDLNQAYTCVEIKTELNDYRANLSSSNQTRVVKVEFTDVAASQIEQVRFSWYSNREDTTYNFSNLDYSDKDSVFRVMFQPTKAMRVAAPPTMEVQLIQTATTFSLSQFDLAEGDRTNRATIYLVPTKDAGAAMASVEKNYKGVYNGSENVVSKADIVKTNDRKISNVPYGVYCPESSSSEFACSVLLNLPNPVGGTRSNDTFMLVVTLPYGQPDTDFAMEFLCAGGAVCSKSTTDGVTTTSNVARIDGAQVVIDSTGRANDLYRRVEVRLESANTSFAYPVYAMQLLNDSGGNTATVNKDMTVTREYNFYQ